MASCRTRVRSRRRGSARHLANVRFTKVSRRFIVDSSEMENPRCGKGVEGVRGSTARDSWYMYLNACLTFDDFVHRCMLMRSQILVTLTYSTVRVVADYRVPRQSKCSRARRLPSTPMPPEALGANVGAAHAECWRAVDEVVEVAGGHLDAHRGLPDDPRVKSPAVIKVAWTEGNGRSLHFEHAAAQQPPSHTVL
jgi:hypothetical protein